MSGSLVGANGHSYEVLFVRGSRCVSHTSLELATLAQVPFRSSQDFIRSVSSNSPLSCLVLLCPLNLFVTGFNTDF